MFQISSALLFEKKKNIYKYDFNSIIKFFNVTHVNISVYTVAGIHKALK